MKQCTKCDIEKSLSEFHKHNYRKDGYNSVCKICRISNEKQRYNSDPERFKYEKLKRKYGLTKAEHKSMIANQNKACAICQVVMKKVCVDHNHISGNVRGLLCNECNRALGYFKDSLQVLQNAVDYLKSHSS